MSQTIFIKLPGLRFLFWPTLFFTMAASSQANSVLPVSSSKLALLSSQQPIYNPQVPIEKKTGRIAREELRSGVMDSRRTINVDEYLARKNQKQVVVPPNRYRVVGNIRIARPFGNWYEGYGQYRTDEEATKWLAFTAIHFELLDKLSETQQRRLEQAQIQATTISVGTSVQWQDGNASGAVTVTREGTSTSGRYCREFRQEVTVNRETAQTSVNQAKNVHNTKTSPAETMQAMGTACKLQNGNWEVVTTG
ncbi:hypothetical protein [Photobacterium galatheae]|nr:hypothetical protein [Photobacterium galatheae]MCM0150529.1 hypothetical protein [Photobacterium galatheae]